MEKYLIEKFEEFLVESLKIFLEKCLEQHLVKFARETVKDTKKNVHMGESMMTSNIHPDYGITHLFFFCFVSL